MLAPPARRGGPALDVERGEPGDADGEQRGGQREQRPQRGAWTLDRDPRRAPQRGGDVRCEHHVSSSLAPGIVIERRRSQRPGHAIEHGFGRGPRIGSIVASVTSKSKRRCRGAARASAACGASSSSCDTCRAGARAGNGTTLSSSGRTGSARIRCRSAARRSPDREVAWRARSLPSASASWRQCMRSAIARSAGSRPSTISTARRRCAASASASHTSSAPVGVLHARRMIRDHELGLAHERARDRDASGVRRPTGNRRATMPRTRGRAAQHVGARTIVHRARDAVDLERQHDVELRAAIVEQAQVLRHDADAAPQQAQRRAAQLRRRRGPSPRCGPRSAGTSPSAAATSRDVPTPAAPTIITTSPRVTLRFASLTSGVSTARVVESNIDQLDHATPATLI